MSKNLPAGSGVDRDAARRRFRRRLGLIAFGLSGGLLIGELCARVFDLGPKFEPIPHYNYQLCEDPVRRYELVPGSEYLGTPINADGMRDVERALRKPPGTHRIAAMGDSVTYGLYVPFDEIFPVQLERRLNRRDGGTGSRHEVLNFGVTGYNITQVVATLGQRAMKYDPDLILYAYCLNDPSEFSGEFQTLRNRAGRAGRFYLDQVLHHPHTWLGHLRLYRIAYFAWLRQADGWGRVPPRRVQRQGPRPDAPQEVEFFYEIHEPGGGWERILEGMASLAEIAAVGNIPVVVAIFPVLDRLDDYPFEDIHARVQQAARHHDFHVIDLLKSYLAAAADSDEPLNTDSLHPSGIGHAVAADAIFEALLDAGLIGDAL